MSIANLLKPSKLRRGSRMDYKRKLERKVSSASPERSVDTSEPHAVQIGALAHQAGAGRTAFQSVAVTAHQLLEHVLRCDRQATSAALSLGQREKLDAMIGTVETTEMALREVLSEQGTQMLGLCAVPPVEKGPADEDGSWWFALTEALETLEDSAQQMASLAESQPEDSPAHRLGEVVASLMKQHHADLLTEAEQWID